MKFLNSLWQNASYSISNAILNYGTRRFMIFVLATIALLDAFVPVTPNIFIVILAILQPMRNKTIVFIFALAAGLSSFLFAIILSEFSGTAQTLGMNTFGESWDTAQKTVTKVGPGLLVFLSIFPDIPRPSIAVMSLSGIEPQWIGLMVFTGKLLLYSGIIALVKTLPSFLSKQRNPSWRLQVWMQIKARRFEAYQRRLKYVVKQIEKRERK